MAYEKYDEGLLKVNNELKEIIDDNIGPAIMIFVTKDGVQVVTTNFIAKRWPKYVTDSIDRLAQNYAKFLSKLPIRLHKLMKDEADRV